MQAREWLFIIIVPMRCTRGEARKHRQIRPQPQPGLAFVPREGRVFVIFGPICVLQPYFVDSVLAEDVKCCVRKTFFVFGAQGTRANVAKPW